MTTALYRQPRGVAKDNQDQGTLIKLASLTSQADEYLGRIGVAVLRYSNVEILRNQEGILQDILDHVTGRIANTLTQRSHDNGMN